MGSNDMEKLVNIHIPTYPSSVIGSFQTANSNVTEIIQEESSSVKPEAPEQKLTLTAFRLALLEKISCTIGKLAFIWATVVLLGGFVSSLKSVDFWGVSVLLITGGVRVFCRSVEVQWQNISSSIFSTDDLIRASSDALHKGKETIQSMMNGLSPKPNTSPGPSPGPELSHEEGSVKQSKKKPKIFRFSIKRTWSKDKLPFLPYASNFFASRVSNFFYLLQVASAMVAVGFSVYRLVIQDYYQTQGQSQDNLGNALNAYYVLMISEASIFLLEKAYFEIKINYKKLLLRVNNHLGLSEDREMVKSFFYDVYSACLKGSIFDGIEEDLVHFAIHKINSANGKEQCGGVKMLSAFVNHDEFGGDALRRIGTSPGVIERLLDMLTWKNDPEIEIRKATAKILCELVYHNSNCFRIVAAAGGLEAIVSLLLDDGGEHSDELKVLGLNILKRLAKDHRHCVKIGQSRGLIAVLVESIKVKDNITEARDPIHPIQGKIFKKSLQLLSMFAAVTGMSGPPIRDDIAKAVFALANLRDILLHVKSKPKFQELAVDILTSLGLEENIRKTIGSTGGVIQVLVSLFLRKHPSDRVEYVVSLKAGEALIILTWQSPRNCFRIVGRKENDKEGGTLKKIIERLGEDTKVSTCAAKILRNLCTYLNDEQRHDIILSSQTVMKRIIRGRDKQLEAYIGLAVRTIPLLPEPFYISMFQEINKSVITKVIARILSEIPPPSTHVPSLRRHTVELLTELMKRDVSFLEEFRKEKFEMKLEYMLENITEVENFYTISGAMGVVRHKESLEDIIEGSLAYLQMPKEELAT